MAEAEKHSIPPRFDSSQYNKSDEGMGLAPGYYLRDVNSHIELHFLTQGNTCSFLLLLCCNVGITSNPGFAGAPHLARDQIPKPLGVWVGPGVSEVVI